MSEERLAGDLTSLLDAERARPGIDAASKVALLARLSATLALPPLPVGAPPGSAPSAPSAPVAAPPSPPVASPTLPPTAATSAGGAALTIARSRAIGALLVAFTMGGVAGGVASRAAAPADAPAPIERSVVPAPAAAASVEGVATSTPPAPTTADPPASAVLRVGDLPDVAPSASSVAHKEGAGSDADLGAERSLLDEARAATSRGNAADALTALDKHARRFPHGRMSEEREALRVVALASAGRDAESRERRAEFQRRFPKSLVLPPASPSARGGAVDSETDRRRDAQ